MQCDLDRLETFREDRFGIDAIDILCRKRNHPRPEKLRESPDHPSSSLFRSTAECQHHRTRALNQTFGSAPEPRPHRWQVFVLFQISEVMLAGKIVVQWFILLDDKRDRLIKEIDEMRKGIAEEAADAQRHVDTRTAKLFERN